MLIKLHPELLNIVAIDGSLINATHSMHWADYRNGSKKVKIHVVFDSNHEIQSKIFFTDGKGAERPFVGLIITLARKSTNHVMPDLIRHPVFPWIALKLHFVPGFRRNDEHWDV